jgi:hypothetical protein
MATIGAAASPFLPVPERANVIAGILTLYLVWSGWASVRSKQIVAGRPEMLGLIVAMTTVATGALWAIQAGNSPTGTLDDTPPQAFYVFIIIGTFATIGDLRLILRGRLAGAPRLSRHVWRMCLALFIASGSFFLGQQRVMPVWMRGSPWLFVPAFAPLFVMIYWLIRIRLKNGVATRLPHASGANVAAWLALHRWLSYYRVKPQRLMSSWKRWSRRCGSHFGSTGANTR